MEESLGVSISEENYCRVDALDTFNGVLRIFVNGFGQQVKYGFDLVRRETLANVGLEPVADHAREYAFVKQPRSRSRLLALGPARVLNCRR